MKQKNKPSTITTSEKPQLIPCESCVYQIEKQCRLFPPTIQGGWAVYPSVSTKNHGCFQGELK